MPVDKWHFYDVNRLRRKVGSRKGLSCSFVGGLALIVLVLVVLAGCASKRVVEQTRPANDFIARPNQIWVYDFIADPASVPRDSAIRYELSMPSTPPTAEQIATGRQLGALIAKDLVADIQRMVLPSAQANPETLLNPGDGLVRGYLVSVEARDAVKRLVIGSGYGTSEMDAVVEGYVTTPNGFLRKLGSGMLSSSGSKTPGLVVPGAVALATGNSIGLIVVGGVKVLGEVSGKSTLEAWAKATADAIAEQLRVRFQDRSWIS